jgi:hypothetical protein
VDFTDRKTVQAFGVQFAAMDVPSSYDVWGGLTYQTSANGDVLTVSMTPEASTHNNVCRKFKTGRELLRMAYARELSIVWKYAVGEDGRALVWDQDIIRTMMMAAQNA